MRTAGRRLAIALGAALAAGGAWWLHRAALRLPDPTPRTAAAPHAPPAVPEPPPAPSAPRSAERAPTPGPARPPTPPGVTPPAVPPPLDPAAQHAEVRAEIEQGFAENFPDRRLSGAELDRMADALVRVRDAQLALLAAGPLPAESARLRELQEALARATGDFEYDAEMPLAEWSRQVDGEVVLRPPRDRPRSAPPADQPIRP